MEVLQKKFGDFQKDLAANEARVSQVNSSAQRLTKEKHPDIELISTRLQVRTSSQCVYVLIHRTVCPYVGTLNKFLKVSLLDIQTKLSLMCQS